MTLWRWFMDRLERLGDLASDAFADDDPDESVTDDDADKAVAWVACPECGQAVPITMAPVRLDVDDEGQRVAIGELLMDDVWAHAWTHDPDLTADLGTDD